MKRFKIESIAIVNHRPDCYRVTIYESPTGYALGQRIPTIEDTVCGLTAVEALVGVITRLGLTAQVTDELSRKSERSANVQEREALLAIVVAKCPHCSATGDDIRLDFIFKAGHEAFICRLCGHDWTEGES